MSYNDDVKMWDAAGRPTRTRSDGEILAILPATPDAPERVLWSIGGGPISTGGASHTAAARCAREERSRQADHRARNSSDYV